MDRRGQRAFTLVELTVALALVVVLLGLVIVRFGGFTPRQHLAGEARKLGNTIETCRGMAALEETLYVLTLDRETGAYTVRKPAERSQAAIERAPVIRTGRLDGVHLKTAWIQDKEISGTILLEFDARCLQPAWRLDLYLEDKAAVSLSIDPLVNEVRYEER
ncbi:MAG: prepilin-type N-terminal cleavage/methylation domain-containing protein [Planctomycetes bacterium]|nr:prepilin-type N-terminal cleavage/methylation domain-containing protein [Planctomycetota bacterium]